MRLQKPDQRHLGRAADAAAGRDAVGDLWVLVQLRNTPPFDVLVFGNETEAQKRVASLNAKATNDASLPFWAIIPCVSEPSAFNRGELDQGLNIILHDWWSPLFSIRVQEASPQLVGDYILTVTDKQGRAIKAINLTQELRAHRGSQGDTDPQVDAVFFSFEAADKFLMPHLAGTYGVKGGWQMRNLLKRGLGDQLRPDLEDLDAAL